MGAINDDSSVILWSSEKRDVSGFVYRLKLRNIYFFSLLLRENDSEKIQKTSKFHIFV